MKICMPSFSTGSGVAILDHSLETAGNHPVPVLNT